jgi:ADP-heptose:LPS heptosyltransferase
MSSSQNAVPVQSCELTDVARGTVQRVLVFHIGSLGDTLVALPSFWSIAHAFPEAERVMLTKAPARGGIPVGRDILDGSGLFHDYLMFEGDHHSYGRDPPWWRKWLSVLRLAITLRARHFDVAVYLAPSAREPAQVHRDLLFFRLAGISRVLGAQAAGAQDAKVDRPLKEAQRLLGRLAGTPAWSERPLGAHRDLALGESDRAAVAQWLATRVPLQAAVHPWVAFAPGSNMASKLWPAERFEAVGRALIQRHRIWPVVVGGAEDREVAARLVQAWGCGTDAAGALTVRQSAALLERCKLFVGNDTGTMHLAAAGGLPCVALFSARDEPGKWDPMGGPHHVIRKAVPCAGCMLVRCEERDRLCLRLIEVDEVVAAAEDLLRRREAAA